MDSIVAMLSSDLGTKKCVLVKSDGASELEIDMHPQKQEVAKALGGPVEFLGQYEPLGVVVVVRRQDEFDGPAGVTLPKPLDMAYKGPALLTRSLDDGSPADFALDEWLEFKDADPQPWQLEDYPAEEASEEDEDEDDDDGALKDQLMEATLSKFEETHGRPPTDDERAGLEAAMGLLANDESDDEESGDEEEDGAEAVIHQLVEQFNQRHGRDPTQDEVQQWAESLRSATMDAALSEIPPAKEIHKPAKRARTTRE